MFFDQIVKGNVIIKKLSKYRCKITFSKIGKFLMYQVWDKDNTNNINDRRSIESVFGYQWVNLFKRYNEDLEKNDKLLFTPTTVMETEDNHRFAFVIDKAYLNSRDQVVFTVSTKQISLGNNNLKKLIQLPLGKCNNVRFDIDARSNGPYRPGREIKYCNEVYGRNCGYPEWSEWKKNYTCPGGWPWENSNCSSGCDDLSGGCH